ncbi:hypothetical protein ONS95_004696 [Cadophora gregata]|uniref:uncharacterized protein n=1 Tax=Cadophora gregata TaxID=51156 RepID=UPI0026DD6850|nr:uncharacterized protein ONS95_004696 [Cadophora gregata]KAK0099488.1 hypothetical protein ONS96_008325 [Cadophora gregata f. sp. sojae]KAK0104401.1 hypothetical protein ONS95_004696 [Cadophora gregata]
MSVRETYKIAHTARCKLQMAADRPDRDLRFILGHAFTLDKLRLRIAEIEVSGSSDSDSEPEDEGGMGQHNRAVCSGAVPVPVPGPGPGPGQDGMQRRVSFQTGKAGGRGERERERERERDRKRSPPPPPLPSRQPPMLEEDTESGSSEEEDDDDIEIDNDNNDEEGEDLGLVRFGSAAAQPPRYSPVPEPRIMGEDVLADENGVASSLGEGDVLEGQEVDIGVTDPKKFSEEELKRLCEGKGSEELRDAYFGVAGCPCHGEKGPRVERFWELPKQEGVVGPRLAVVQVA